MVMAYVPFSTTMQFEAFYTVNGAETENVLGFYYGANDFNTAAVLVCGAYETHVWGALRGLSTPATVFRSMKCTDLTSDTSPVYIQTADPLTNTGTVLTDSVPNNAALVICFSSNARGRSSRGRNYIAGLAEGLKLNSAWLTGAYTPLLAAYEDMRVEAQSSAISHVVLSRITDGVPRTLGATFLVDQYSIKTPAVRSQRRRNLGVGT